MGKCTIVPPSTTRVWPVVNADKSDSRNRSGPAISSVRPNRRSRTPFRAVGVDVRDSIAHCVLIQTDFVLRKPSSDSGPASLPQPLIL